MKSSFLINRDFALLFIGRLVSDIGNHFYMFAIGWYVLSLTESAAQAGFYMAFGGIVYIVCTPLAGVLVDRLDRIKIIYVTDYIRGFSILVASLFIFYQPILNFGLITVNFADVLPQLVVLYLTAFIFSVNGALFNPAITASIPYLVKDDQLQKANSLNAGLGAFVSILGGLLAGSLYTLLGIGVILLIIGVSYIVSAISEMFIHTRSLEKNDQPLTLTLALREFGEGFHFLLQKQGMLVFVIVVLIINMLAAPLFGVAQPYFFNQIVQSDPLFYSLIGFGFSLGSMLMALFLSNQTPAPLVNRPLRRGLLGFTLGIGIYSLIVYLFVDQGLPFGWMFGLMATVSLIMGLIITYVNTPIGIALQRYVPKDKLGRVNAIINLLAQGLIPFSTALAGILIDTVPLSFFYLFVAIGMGLATFIAYQSKSLRAF